jgi:nucleotide-binding universal stress UspA family protein
LIIGRVKRLKDMPGIKRVLIGVDFSEGSKLAVSYGFSIAQECQANVTLIHVADFVMGDVVTPYKQPLIDGIRIDLERLVPEEAPNWCRVTTRIEFGLPYRVILERAVKEKTDIIVLGTQGKNLVERTLLGSNAERVIRGASCPVLAVPFKPGEKSPRTTKKA